MADFDRFDEKLKLTNFLIMLVFWATNISLPTQKLPYSQICGPKVGTSYKKRRLSNSTQLSQTDILLLVSDLSFHVSQLTVFSGVSTGYSI